jgi:hypothetical protein
MTKSTCELNPLARPVADGMMTAAQSDLLRRGGRERQKVLIAPPSSGNTTLANVLLAEIAITAARVLALEDTVELQRAARPRTAAYAGKRGVHDRAGALVHAPSQTSMPAGPLGYAENSVRITHGTDNRALL